MLECATHPERLVAETSMDYFLHLNTVPLAQVRFAFALTNYELRIKRTRSLTFYTNPGSQEGPLGVLSAPSPLLAQEDP